LVWSEDAPIFDSIAEAVKNRQFVWIDAGRYSVATIHVENLASALLAALSSTSESGAYFVSDGEEIQFRHLVEVALRSRNLKPPNLSLPKVIARVGATIAEAMWNLLRLKGKPPITHTLVDLIGGEFRVNDAKARKELGYTNRISVDHGLERFRKMQ
jgi:nucleoside-diphosphate-sugar epimerase